MIPSISTLTALSLSLCSAFVAAQVPADLVGTWVTKGRSVVTGPDFYDPVADKLIEPRGAGISYSFSSDGFYEQSFYRSIPNPTTPNCPSAMLQWQHGTFSLPGNGSILLSPISVDGRQLLSSPCTFDSAVYTRYDQPELIKSYQTLTDDFHNVPRLNLFRFNGAPEQPLYLAYRPPQMLPTMTLNPTGEPTDANGGGQPQATSRVKRDEERSHQERWREGMVKNTVHEQDYGDNALEAGLLRPRKMRWDPERWWWVGCGFLAVGSVMYMLPTKL